MELNIKQRFAVVGIYLLLLISIGYYFSNDWSFLKNSNERLNSLLITTALALILSAYITEPYFSKPVDVITRWVAIYLFVIGLNNKESLLFYKFWQLGSGIFISIALILIFFHNVARFEKLQRIAVDVICKISRPEIVFTILYFDIVLTFFQSQKVEFPILVGFGFLLAINKPVIWVVKFISTIISQINTKSNHHTFLGKIIGHDSTDVYHVEVTTDNSFRQKILKGKLVYLENISNGVPGIILNERVLLGKKWLEVLSFRDADQNLISFNLKTSLPLGGEKTIFSKTNAVFLLEIDSIQDELRTLIFNHPIYSKFEKLIGNVAEDTTLNKIKFNKLFTTELQNKYNIGEGSLISVAIGENEVLYQIIAARTEEEKLEYKDSHGYTIGIAQKLGKYNMDACELNTVKWLPEIYTPIFLLDKIQLEYNNNKFIGKLPNTTYGIPIKLPHELITHNTGILGILGIGKSCLTFELIQKTIDSTECKIICLDITGEYPKALPQFVGNCIQELDYDLINNKIKEKYKQINKDIEEGGNHKMFKEIIAEYIRDLYNNADKRILIINPQQFDVSFQVGELKNKKIGNDWIEVASMRDLSIAEITRLVSEVCLSYCKEQGMIDVSRLLIVFEEAHSLVPEWSSASAEGDKAATNGTAKVILQGRKYGLGSFIITQRTANISKSILNQCNTIFAMRIFDDTGKQFLENYIGSDYSQLLPTLEERHCIGIGKALKLKQPVILELNNTNDLMAERHI